MHVVLGILANKDANGIVAALKPHAASLTFVPVPGHEHHDPAELACLHNGYVAPDLLAAIDASPRSSWARSIFAAKPCA